MNGIKVKAKDLRQKEVAAQIPKDKPGYYKWWANENDFKDIASKLNVTLPRKDIQTTEIGGEKYSCVYIGIAANESLYHRIVKWHICQKHSESQVRHKTLSTLRQTISALFGENMMDKDKTNEIIDRLVVEYFVSDNAIHSEEARSELHGIEKDLLKGDTLYILNIQENKHPDAPTKLLMQLRRGAWEMAE